MRLSEQILLGSMTLVPVAYKRHSGDQIQGCALGMAETASGISDYGAEHRWPWLNGNTACPCGCKTYKQRGGKIFIACPIESYAQAIAHIFNEHVMEDKTWTLEQLVDWIRSVEPAEPEPVPEVVALVEQTDLPVSVVSRWLSDQPEQDCDDFAAEERE